MGGCCAEPNKAVQVERMDGGCLLAVQGEGMFGEDYQVFISDGRAVGQVLVLGRRDPAAGGKRVQPQGSIPLKIQCQALLFKNYHFLKFYCTVTETTICVKVCVACRFELWDTPEMSL